MRTASDEETLRRQLVPAWLQVVAAVAAVFVAAVLGLQQVNLMIISDHQARGVIDDPEPDQHVLHDFTMKGTFSGIDPGSIPGDPIRQGASAPVGTRSTYKVASYSYGLKKWLQAANDPEITPIGPWSKAVYVGRDAGQDRYCNYLVGVLEGSEPLPDDPEGKGFDLPLGKFKLIAWVNVTLDDRPFPNDLVRRIPLAQDKLFPLVYRCDPQRKPATTP